MLLNLPKNYTTISKDLAIPTEQVRLYFQYYDIFRTNPIRDLNSREIYFVQLMKEVKYYPPSVLEAKLRELNISNEEYINNPSVLLRHLANLSEEEFSIIGNYYNYLIEPAINYGNTRAPLLRPIEHTDMILILSNIAAGIPTISTEQITSTTKVAAVSKLLDIYDKHKDSIADSSKEVTEEIKTAASRMSPEQLKIVMELASSGDPLPNTKEALRKSKPKKKKKTTSKAKPKTETKQKEEQN